MNYCNELSCQLSLLSTPRISKRTPIQIQEWYGKEWTTWNTHISCKCFRKSSGMWVQLLGDARLLCIREKHKISLHAFTLHQPLPTAVIHLFPNSEMWTLITTMSQGWIYHWIYHCSCSCPQQIQKYHCIAWFSLWKMPNSCNPNLFVCLVFVLNLKTALAEVNSVVGAKMQGNSRQKVHAV